ncbi:MAG TPA: carbon-nitrogen hydrolase family protein [Candidatus Cybelea sp.]|nr:carbon-nitrogen hydrolase family protein [Candidatus Cybelea sp.]
MATFNLACVQITSGDDIEANIAATSALIHAAHLAGADLIATPENTGLMAAKSEVVLAKAQVESEHRPLAAYRALAAELKTWLLIGSLAVKLPGEPRIANRSYLLDPAGRVVASYDKIHMFDVELATGEKYRESRTYRPGETARVVPLPWGMLGITVCYDLRFPHLYRALAQAGASFLSIPSAFTRPTGQAHWHVLMRARAIETGCFVFAPAQCGVHPGNRKTYGHSLIVAPWGEVLADGGDDPGFVIAEIDPAKVDEARRQVPSLGGDRPFTLDAPARAAE